MIINMSVVTLDSKVADLVIERPSRSRIFMRFGIDFCCGGRRPLQEACNAVGVDPQSVLAELAKPTEEHELPDRWFDAPLVELIDHIVATHHVFTKAELPRVSELLAKVSRAHGEKHPFMVEVREIYEPFAEELLLHMHKEERVLFPALRELAVSADPAIWSTRVAPPIARMQLEHDEAGAALAKVRSLTSGFALPEGGCPTFRAALDGLEGIESDLHRHVHLENNMLFRRALVG